MASLFGYVDPAEQAAMLLDRVRVDAFARAIAATVRPGDVVVDVGAGTGVLAMLAARAGARRVYAIERTGVIALARELIAANHLTDVVELVRADALTVDALPEPPRVIVGELLGHFAPAEGAHRVFQRARGWCRPDAVTVPASYRLVIAAARPRGLAAELAALADVGGLDLGAVGARLRRRVTFARLTADDLVGPEVAGAAHALDAPTPARFTATVPVALDGPVTALAVSFVATLAPGVELCSAVGATATHWVQAVFPIDPPLAARAGDALAVELEPRVAVASDTWTWTVRAGDQVRVGDAVDALVGERDDLLAQLGVRRRGPRPAPPEVAALAVALGAAPPAELDANAMAARLTAAWPARYPTPADASAEVVLLLRALDRLRPA